MEVLPCGVQAGGSKSIRKIYVGGRGNPVISQGVPGKSCDLSRGTLEIQQFPRHPQLTAEIQRSTCTSFDKRVAQRLHTAELAFCHLRGKAGPHHHLVGLMVADTAAVRFGVQGFHARRRPEGQQHLVNDGRPRTAVAGAGLGRLGSRGCATGQTTTSIGIVAAEFAVRAAAPARRPSLRSGVGGRRQRPELQRIAANRGGSCGLRRGAAATAQKHEDCCQANASKDVHHGATNA